jgi:glycosyltransferase involved in cell wall biosynthesis
MISVITPTYKRPDLLLRCIRSLQSQTYENYEHIIFSDHCPKAKQVYDLVKEDKRIKFFENTNPHVWNAGAIGKNYGVQVAESEFICYCDDDNILLTNHLEIMNKHFSDGCDLVFTKNVILDFEDYVNLEEKNANGVIKETLLTNLIDIATNPRLTYVHVLDYENYMDIPFDTICIGHTKSLYNKTNKWQPACELKTNNEDGPFVYSLKDVTAAYNLKVMYDRQFTSLYFSTHGSGYGKDFHYINKVDNLNDDEVFVYPDLLIKNNLL